MAMFSLHIGSVLIGEVDENIDAQLDLDEVRAAPIPEVIY